MIKFLEQNTNHTRQQAVFAPLSFIRASVIRANLNYAKSPDDKISPLTLSRVDAAIAFPGYKQKPSERVFPHDYRPRGEVGACMINCLFNKRPFAWLLSAVISASTHLCKPNTAPSVHCDKWGTVWREN